MTVCVKCSKLKKLKKHKNNYYCSKCYNLYCRPQKECIDCYRTKAVEKYTKFGPVCSSCYLKYKQREVCYVCNKKGIVSKKDTNGFICKKCYNREFRPKEECIVCQKYKVVNTRTKNGPLCKSCYKTPKQNCSLCNKENHIRKQTKGLKICESCYFKYRYLNDEKFNVLHKLRSRIQIALNSYLKLGKTKKCKDYNINYKKIIIHLGQSPGTNFHIDHIFPLSAFDFRDPAHIEAAFAPENHQWLTAEENFNKSSKYNEKSFKTYLKKFVQKRKGEF